MATFYSNLYARQTLRGTASGAETAAGSDYSYIGPRGERAGQTVTVEGTFTCPAALATSDLANLFPIPAGAKIDSFDHYYEDFGTTCTTTVECDTTDMKASIALGTAVTVGSIASLSKAECAAAWAANASADKNVRLAFTSVSTPTAGAVYTFVCKYTMPS